MAPFLGLQGNRLNLVALFGILMPSIVSLGYNQSLLGGVLTLDAFEKQFPEIAPGFADETIVNLAGGVLRLRVGDPASGLLECRWVPRFFPGTRS